MSVNEALNQPLKLGPVNGHQVCKTLALANFEGSNVAQLNVLSSFTVSILLSFVEYTFVLLPDHKQVYKQDTKLYFWQMSR